MWNAILSALFTRFEVKKVQKLRLFTKKAGAMEPPPAIKHFKTKVIGVLHDLQIHNFQR